MIGKITGAIAGRSLQHSVGRIVSGPTGALITRTLPFALPRVARRMGVAGMLAAAVGGVVLNRWLIRRDARKAIAAEAGPASARSPEAILGGPVSPQALEGEWRQAPDN